MNEMNLKLEYKGFDTEFGSAKNWLGRWILKYPDTMARTKMVRTDKYKLVIRLKGGNELYDMEMDPYEMNNLWGDIRYNNVTLELMQLMVEWCLETDTDQPFQSNVGA